MAEEEEKVQPEITELDSGTYEIIRDRLLKQSEDLRQKLANLNESRKQVFGSIESKLIATERITTDNNCFARDIVSLQKDLFIFGYNVHMGLKTETHISDVFNLYRYDAENHSFHNEGIGMLEDPNFQIDFANLYKYYRGTSFSKFAEIGPHIFMVFQVGKTPEDIKTFKWLKTDEGLKYMDNRSDHEFVFPDQHEFRWTKVTRDMHRKGLHPHISIEDRLFIETIGGDLTIKVEDNTSSGKGIYNEPVEDADQTLDDAQIHFAIVGNLIVLKVLPYQEEDYRYIVFNEKIQEAIRIDALEDSCVLLPDFQGIIFSRGYYSQTGEVKLFDNQLQNMLFERRIASPNGEDFIYVFYQRGSGTYALMPYNIISQNVSTPIICSGYSLFENGELLYFKAEEEQQKHHLIQIWQTPFHSPNKTVKALKKSYLFKIGNKEIVRAMAECSELLKLIGKGDTYAGLYVDLVRISTAIGDSYHWLEHEESFELAKPLQQIKQSASKAIEEYEKVVRIRRNTTERSQEVTDRADEIIRRAGGGNARTIGEYVERLSALRTSKGEVISLKDLRYMDLEKVDEYDTLLKEVTDQVSQACAKFLMKKEALEPYRRQVEGLQAGVERVKKAIEARKMEEDVQKVSSDLEMLIEIVSNLKIEDATQVTRIIDGISTIYSQFNRINAALRKKRKELVGKEGEAEFNSQIKLINQGLSNYLDICDTPDKCEEYRNKLMVQLEELEGRFAEFDQFITRITEKREEIYSAFDSKKVFLTEARNKRSLAMHQSGERIIEGIRKRLASFDKAEDINAYFASDLMVDKVRDLAQQLLKINDSVKADDLQSQLKSAYQEASRQLKDKNELFVQGENVIKLGKHSFNINTQEVDLSLVNKAGDMSFHITGTNFFEKIRSEDFLSTKDIWGQLLVSENEDVYRSEYLAFSIYKESEEEVKDTKGLEELHQMTPKALLGYVQQRMSQRYDEGYVKGVHDRDARAILQSLIAFYNSIGSLRFSAYSRVLAYLYWHHIIDPSEKEELLSRFEGIRSILKVFPESDNFQVMQQRLANGITHNTDFSWSSPHITEWAAEYLFHHLSYKQELSFSLQAWNLSEGFRTYLKKNRHLRNFEQSLKANTDPLTTFRLAVNWLESYVANADHEKEISPEELLEASIILMDGKIAPPAEHKVSLHMEIDDMVGDHPLIKNGRFDLHFNDFMDKLYNYSLEVVPRFRKFSELKKQLLAAKRLEMRLEEFKPRVMSSFVRNRLIDEVYLPLIGDNLAKQIGAAGDTKRTDLMGMLLLISPPGYGKTTLMEYTANRLGLVFMKINGPAIGHNVTSLDPTVAGNSAAREELEKLNLAFEMGDNIMIYVDDIQHCNPEFLQKFISLCDAQRKVEGVYNGVSKTYDLRGKKVAVVMAGNPYTESGEKFRIPDMLANRADTYNLGDIIGGKDKAFEMSYIENSITSNSILSRLNNKSQQDIYTLIRMAETGEQDDLSFESDHSPEEISEYVNLIKKMIRTRDIIVEVNKKYITSAGQADEYRVEPPFKLQGSYRDMNKIVEKLNPVMNEEELTTLLLSHYEHESQTLTQGAEFNLLKFKEMFGVITEGEIQRKQEIVDTFGRNQKLKGFGGNQMGQVLEQMEVISEGLRQIGNAIKTTSRP